MGKTPRRTHNRWDSKEAGNDSFFCLNGSVTREEDPSSVPPSRGLAGGSLHAMFRARALRNASPPAKPLIPKSTVKKGEDAKRPLLLLALFCSPRRTARPHQPPSVGDTGLVLRQQPERVGNVAAVPGGKIVGEGAPDMPMLRLSLSRRARKAFARGPTGGAVPTEVLHSFSLAHLIRRSAAVDRPFPAVGNAR